MITRCVALSAAVATAALGGLVALPGAASAATPMLLPQTIVVTPPSGLLDTGETRTTGHNDFLEDGLHVWTEGSTSTDKAAGYIAEQQALLMIAAAGEPSQVWTPSGALPPFAAPGKQIVVDFDNNGTRDGTLVGEPTSYGLDWWLSGDAAQFVKDGAPHTGGGSGSLWYGTLAEWGIKFPIAKSMKVGYSLGSGVHGDGVLSSMTYGDTTYTFALGLGPCEALIDSNAKTYTLTKDCSTLATIHVPDGWTVDGNGHKITAVEDTQHPNFPGPIMVSATGTDGDPAALDVTNLAIDTHFTGANSAGLLAGIKFDRAGGSVTDTTITGVTHGNGVQEGDAIYIRNRTAGGAYVGDEVSVNLDNVTVTRYQKTGVIIDGNVSFTMTDSTVGRASDAAGNPIPGTAANSVQISRGAHGTVSGSTIGLNDYNPASAPGDGSDATGILIYDSNAVNITQTVLSGTNADVGIDTYNDGLGGFDTSLSASCNLLQRDEVDGDYDPYGIGIAQWDDGSIDVPVTLSDSTFVGWKHATGVVSGSLGGDDLQVAPGASNSQTGACVPTSPTVSIVGGDGSTDVSWSASSAPTYAPVSGYDVTLTGSDSSTHTVHVDANTTTAHFSGLAEGVDYTASVEAVNASGSSTAGSATVYGTSIILTPDQGTITFKKNTHLHGALTSNDPSAQMVGRHVVIQSQAVGDVTWTPVANVTTNGAGEFTTTVKPKKNTIYRAHYAGNPDMSSTTTASVYVAPKITMAVSDQTVSEGTTVQFSGHASPNQKGRPVLLQRLVGGAWVTVLSDNMNGRSRYSFHWDSTGEIGTYSWRVTIPASAKYAVGHSKKKDVSVS